MYQITYQKNNGEVFNRIRNTIPYSVGDYTSMGWLVVDIKYNFNGKYYSASDYHKLKSRSNKIQQYKRSFKKYIKRYALFIPYIIVLLIK